MEDIDRDRVAPRVHRIRQVERTHEPVDEKWKSEPLTALELPVLDDLSYRVSVR